MTNIPSPAPADQAATSPAEFSPTAWWQVLKRTWREANRDNVGLVAAGVSFYVFLSVLPLLASVVLLYGLVADPASVIEDVGKLSGAMPAEAAKFLAEQMLFVVSTAAEKKGVGLATALALSLFSARAAAGAVIGALNIAYEEDERRGWFSVNLAALVITAAAFCSALSGCWGAPLSGCWRN
jgi:membrane protein